jgi:hypothetical protein
MFARQNNSHSGHFCAVSRQGLYLCSWKVLVRGFLFLQNAVGTSLKMRQNTTEIDPCQLQTLLLFL